jgi:hypothetical protein
MNPQDILMAVVALLLASFAFAAAARNREQDYRLRKIHWIDQRWGRRAARAVYAVVGLLLMASGIAILCGWSVLR